MPHQPSRSRLMRSKNSYTVPPICRSKSSPTGTLTYAECSNPEQQYTATYTDIGFTEFMGIVDEQGDTFGTWSYIDHQKGIQQSGSWNHCGPTGPGIGQVIFYTCVGHNYEGAISDPYNDFQTFMASITYTDSYMEWNWIPNDPTQPETHGVIIRCP